MRLIRVSIAPNSDLVSSVQRPQPRACLANSLHHLRLEALQLLFAQRPVRRLEGRAHQQRVLAARPACASRNTSRTRHSTSSGIRSPAIARSICLPRNALVQNQGKIAPHRLEARNLPRRRLAQRQLVEPVQIKLADNAPAPSACAPPPRADAVGQTTPRSRPPPPPAPHGRDAATPASAQPRQGSGRSKRPAPETAPAPAPPLPSHRENQSPARRAARPAPENCPPRQTQPRAALPPFPSFR